MAATPPHSGPSRPGVPRGLAPGLVPGEEDRSTPKGSHFMKYVLEHSADPDALRNHFFLPPLSDKPSLDIEPPAHPSAHYRDHAPPELKRPGLLRHAERYYEENQTQWWPSIVITKILGVVLLVPATIVYFVLRLAYSLLGKPWIKEQSLDTSVRSSTSEKEESAFEPPPMPGKKLGILHFSRRWALYIVYIPLARLQGSGGFKGAVLPSQSPAFLNDHYAALRKGRVLLKDATEERDQTKRMWKVAVMQRRQAIAGLAAFEVPDYDNPDFTRLLKQYQESAKSTRLFEEAMREAEEEIKEVREVARTDTCTNATSYKGISDWASDAHESYSNLMNAISGVCFVGAGLTYAAIFSAVRGNLGLMSWAFSLFVAGLAILITVQSLLMWCSRLENYPFSTPRLWEFFLGVGVYGACAAVVAAITLLVVTVLNLRFDKGTAAMAAALAMDQYQGGAGIAIPCQPNQIGTQMQIGMNGTTPLCGLAAFGGNYLPGDAHITFDVNPRSSAIFAFAFIGAGIGIAVIVFALFCAANGVQLFLWRRSIERSRMHRVRLADLEYDEEKATKLL